jgi:hypothetical protein
VNIIKLNKKTIDQLEPLTIEAFYWDRELKGFGLKIYKCGRKSFILQGRVNGTS